MACLAEEGVEVKSLPGGGDTMMALPDDFDLAMVDNSALEAEAVCQCINKVWDIPLIVMVRRDADWEKVESLGADGYVPIEAGKAELRARLRAILRRFEPTRKTKKPKPAYASERGQSIS